MTTYKFILKKTQRAVIEGEFDGKSTVEDIINKISEMSEDEMDFGNPEYHLETITRETGKTSKLVWSKENWF